MRVLFLQQQPCIRALKYAVGLRAAQPDLELGFAYRGRSLNEWYGEGDELFDARWRVGPVPARDLRRVVSEWRPDVIHSHNLPDSLTVMALDVTEGRVPVIHDVHDMQSLRSTPYEDGFPDPGDGLALEKRAVEGSAGVVAVSDELLEELRARYEVPACAAVFPNYTLLRDLPQLPPPERSHDGPPRVVYQGTLSTTGGHYDLRGLFRDIVCQGVSLDVYPAREQPAYRALADGLSGLRVHGTLRPGALLRELPRYDFGWAGFNATLNAAHLDTALPNKAFEYAAAGLPILTLGHRALARFVRDHGLGLGLDTLDGLTERLRAVDLPALRRRLAVARLELTFEAQVERVLDLYEEVAAVGVRAP